MAKFYIHTGTSLVPIDTEKADKEYVDVKINDLQNSIDGITDAINIDSSDNEFVITDTNGNIGLKLNSSGLSVKDVTAGEHTLSQKSNQSEVDKKLDRDEFEDVISITEENEFIITDSNGNIGFKLDSTGAKAKDFTTSDDVSLNDLSSKVNKNTDDITTLTTVVNTNVSNIAINTSNINTLSSKVNKNTDDINAINSLIINQEDNAFYIVDNENNIGLKLDESGLSVKDVTAGEHILSQKANQSEVDKKLDRDEFEDVISIAEENTFIITDTNGNIGFKLDSTGAKAKDFTTSDDVSLSGVNADLTDAISRLSTIEGLLEEDGNEVIDNLKDVIDYFNGVKETETGAALLSNVALHTSQISNLTDSVNKNTNNITTNTTNITSLSTLVSTNTTNIAKKLDRIEFTEVINVDGGSGEFVIADENGNIGLKLNNSEGLTVVKDVTVKDNDTTHVLSQKADKTYVDNELNDKLNTEDFNNVIKVEGSTYSTITINEDGITSSGNVTATVSDVTHILSEKADKTYVDELDKKIPSVSAIDNPEIDTIFDDIFK